MRRLVDGAHAIIKLPPELSEIRDLGLDLLAKVPAEEQADLAALSTGVPDDEPPSALFTRLQKEGLADEGLDPVDPAVLARLEDIGRGFAWTLPVGEGGDEERDALVHLLRRAHARRKSFLYAFGQTYCTPEAGVARCLHVQKSVPPGGKVLLVGDDDLLSLPLAALGFEVTTIDIDGLVIDFIGRAAADEGLKVDARVYDVLAPLDDELIGRFDAVFTDPMSYEDCFVAFWSRGLAVIKEGGRLVTCVQPYTRHVFHRLLERLPAVVDRYRYRFSSYYTYSFAENLYRSDLVELTRTPGDPPFLPSDRIPFENITQGMISAGYHAFGHTHGMRMAVPKHLDAAMISQVLTNSGRYQVVDAGHLDDGRYLHSFLSLEDGGHVAVVLDTQRAEIAFSGYPWHEEREQWLMLLLKQTVRGVTDGLWYADAARLPARPVIFSDD
jgi:hypothetical protein